ncbi:hypothetical protein Aeqsu_2225 [Aequorivita sublithincola DSM 14238]|uniref:CUB domain-containing protein n=1 Tax=Aequorivita sublithincola (strain DSM 14238 / LMG 21431 / ACAM 643 / 9-3) TaxID=746697 RepID=I3YXG7_AEQSU|nr:hypothetical protein [Aequorivita sublithincola]AFL81685.1 hypothetical protein Aeqsu_2225 [Aequorivita sublithincola DSM 14238]
MSLSRWVVVGYARSEGFGRNIYKVTGNTDINTDSSSFSSMADMSLTFTPKRSMVYVNFSASGTMDKGGNSDAQGYAAFRMMNGATQIAGTTTIATDRSFSVSGSGGIAFYDSGGKSSNYFDNETITSTYNPVNPADKVSVSFSFFNTESTFDGLMIYNGPNASFPLLSSGSNYNYYACPNGAYTGTGLYSAQGKTFTSTDASGALTFVFTSDTNTRRAGWEASVTSSIAGPPTSGYSLDTAWNTGFTMYPVQVTPGVETIISIQWLRDGNPGLPKVLRNNVNTNRQRSHRNLTIID